MRLIHTETLQFEVFYGTQVPEYAILSHTWEEEEVTYDAYQDAEARKSMKGWRKIEDCCKMAPGQDFN